MEGIPLVPASWIRVPEAGKQDLSPDWNLSPMVGPVPDHPFPHHPGDSNRSPGQQGQLAARLAYDGSRGDNLKDNTNWFLGLVGGHYGTL